MATTPYYQKHIFNKSQPPHLHVRNPSNPPSSLSHKLLPPCHCPTPHTSKPTPYTPLTFPLFPHLPLELRLQIWSFTLPPQRIIELRSWGDTRLLTYHPIKYSLPPISPPITLSICQESRREALRHYKVVEIGVSESELDKRSFYLDWSLHPFNPRAVRKGFWKRMGFPLAYPYPTRKVYVDWEVDVVYFGPEFRVKHLKQFLSATGKLEELKGLRTLALDRKLWMGSVGVEASWLRDCILGLRNRGTVKEIWVVPDDCREALQDGFYYKEHRIEMAELEEEGLRESRKEVEDMEERVKAVWKDGVWREGICRGAFWREARVRDGAEGGSGSGSGGSDGDKRDKTDGNEVKVRVMSVKREGRSHGFLREGMVDVHQRMFWGLETWRGPVKN